MIRRQLVSYGPAALSACLALGALGVTGCHSRHIETVVENRTGGDIKLLEVDYPIASFGAGSLASGADLHYRIQLRDSSPIKVQYTGADGRTVELTGPEIGEPQEGQLEIVLLPAAKAEFHPHLTPALTAKP